jgi:hypothetical protein
MVDGLKEKRRSCNQNQGSLKAFQAKKKKKEKKT